MKVRGSKDLLLEETEEEKPVLKRVPFKLSSMQSKAMRNQMFEVEHYKTTEKSKWLSEALESLLMLPNWMDVVEGVLMSQRETNDSHIVLMNEGLKLKLDEAILKLKQNAFDGKIEKVRAPVGTIMRAAVMHRVNPISNVVLNAIELAKSRLEEDPKS